MAPRAGSRVPFGAAASVLILPIQPELLACVAEWRTSLLQIYDPGPLIAAGHPTEGTCFAAPLPEMTAG